MKRTIVTLSLFFLTFAGGCANKEDQDSKMNTEKKKVEETQSAFSFNKAKAQKVDHIHGIAYPGNDQALYVASHEGLKIYKDSVWMESNQNNHDYMGFQPIEDGFVASGHPEKGSGLKNPLGLVKSTDNGASLEKLAFYGESDFHFLSASYSDDAFYVINEHENSKLKPGLFYSTDQGNNWSESKLKGFNTDTLGMIAVHPEKGSMMAMATKNGVYFSDDYGNTMEPLTDSVMTTAISFSKDSIFYSTAEKDKVGLIQYDVDKKTKVEVNIPFLDYTNPIIYIALNQNDPNKRSIATYEHDLYESTDGGANWKQIMKKGRIE